MKLRRNFFVELLVWGMIGISLLLSFSGCSSIDKGADGGRETELESTIIDSGSLPEMETSVSESQELWTEETMLPVHPKAEESKEESRDSIREIIIATDLHYLNQDLTDYGERFTYMVEHGDGRMMTYIEELMNAFTEEVIARKPEALVLSGDLSYNGEKYSHEELAAILSKVEEAGIPVVVIPGNHDINNKLAAGYEGTAVYPVELTSPDDFASIYQDFGYGEALSRDKASLSYTYELDDTHWLLMLDSCQYRPVNKIGGMIRNETYDWIENQIELADKAGKRIIPVSHHNLLDESEVYVDDCTIEHSEMLIELLENWDVPIYFSGHLHVQHNKQNGSDGIWEIVTGALVVPPCQYGVLQFTDTGVYDYHTQVVDVEAWALKSGSRNKELLDFSGYKEIFLKKVFYNQARGALTNVQLTEIQKDQMAHMFADLNVSYYAGKAVEIKDAAINDPSYHLWENHVFDSILVQYMQSILNDAVRDYNTAEVVSP